MTPSETYETLADFAQSLADAGRQIARESFRRKPNVRRKADTSLVSDIDECIERVFRAEITARYPSHGIFGEEQAALAISSQFLWILDPIDGTESYVHGLPIYGILIGLLHHGVPVVGVADMPQLGERWVSFAGDSTRLNEVPVRALEARSLHKATVFTTTPDVFEDEDKEVLERIRSSVRMMRYGGDCYSYCLLASGHIDAVIECGLGPYDYLPLVPIIEGSGGVITDWEGNNLSLSSGGKVVAAGSVQMHAAMLAIISRAK